MSIGMFPKDIIIEDPNDPGKFYNAQIVVTSTPSSVIGDFARYPTDIAANDLNDDKEYEAKVIIKAT